MHGIVTYMMYILCSGYLPPEYIEGEIISIKSDIYSLGVVIIKIMTGPEGYFRSAEISSQEFVMNVPILFPTSRPFRHLQQTANLFS